MSNDEWDATYAAEGELIFEHELGTRTVVVPETFHARWQAFPKDDYLVTFHSFSVAGDAPVVGFRLNFKDAASTRLTGVSVTQPRHGGVSTSYGLMPRRPVKWTEMAIGKPKTSRMDDRFDLTFTRTRDTAWELRVEAQDPDDPPYWLTSGIFRLEVSSLERPWGGLLASFATRAKRQSARGRIELTLTERGLVYPGYGRG